MDFIKYYFTIELNIHKKKIKWSGRSSGYNAKVPKYVADIAELIEIDPDPYFEGV